jgi:hypothetical protein
LNFVLSPRDVFTHNSFWPAGFLYRSYKIYVIVKELFPSAGTPGGDCGLKKGFMEDTSDDTAVIILWEGGGISSN